MARPFEIIEPKPPERFHFPWTGASSLQRRIFHISGVMGALLPVGLFALAMKVTSVTHSNNVSSDTWADAVVSFCMIIPCAGLPIFIGFMWLSYVGVGYLAVGVAGLLGRT